MLDEQQRRVVVEQDRGRVPGECDRRVRELGVNHDRADGREELLVARVRDQQVIEALQTVSPFGGGVEVTAELEPLLARPVS